MAASDKTKTTEAPEAGKTGPGDNNTQDSKQTSGQAVPESVGTSDTALADAAGITEGEVRALRDDAGLDQLAGHEGDIHAWSVSPAGKAFKADEKKRQQSAKDEEKSYAEQTDKNGFTEAEAAYVEAVKKG